jgi:hypothetical protein
MKTAISIPKDVFTSAERMAKEMKLSRSALYTEALKEFVRCRKNTGITHQLNEVYAGLDSRLEPGLAAMQRKTWAKDESGF